MNRSRPLLACVLMLAALGLSGCTCEEAPASCGTSFEWSAWWADGELVPGYYTFTVTLDDADVYEVDCQIQATLGDSDCYGTNHVEGEAEYVVAISILNDDSSPSDPAAVFSLHASRPGDGPNTAPRSVVIAVDLDEAALAVVEYALDDAGRADHRCGQCDGPQRYGHEFD